MRESVSGQLGLWIAHDLLVTASLRTVAFIRHSEIHVPQSAFGWWGTREGIAERPLRLRWIVWVAARLKPEEATLPPFRNRVPLLWFARFIGGGTPAPLWFRALLPNNGGTHGFFSVRQFTQAFSIP